MRFLAFVIAVFAVSLLHAQPGLRNLQPKTGAVPDLGPAADEAFRKRDSLLQLPLSELTAEGQAELNRLLEKYDETCENKWQILGGGCSWYCGGGPYTIKSSSSLGGNYKADYIHDLSFQYAWVEGAKGNGVGEWITYYFKNKSPRINEIIIYNGYLKSEDAWKNNARVKKLKLLVNDVPYAILHLQDTKAQQSFAVPLLGHRKDGKDLVMKFQVMEVYPGLKYEDLAITEIYFDGIDVH